MDSVSISLPFAFLAGLVSFVSPCVLPVVPAYVAYVSGLTLDELAREGSADLRRKAVLHSSLFIIGFLLVFMTLGASATAAGQAFNRALPAVTRLGGVGVILFGALLLDWVRLPALARDVRVGLSVKPTGALGSLAVGVVFGAGWTPCIGPILATILFYATMEPTVFRGSALLALYGLGLGIPFFAAAVAFNWFLASLGAVRRWALPARRAAGILMIIAGVLLVSGKFAAVSASLADLGQWVDLEM